MSVPHTNFPVGIEILFVCKFGSTRKALVPLYFEMTVYMIKIELFISQAFLADCAPRSRKWK